jgi:peptidase S58-like protein
MTIPTGTRLSPYEILAPLGAVGMGEVCRARDAKLRFLGRVAVLIVLAAIAVAFPIQAAERARDWGIPFTGQPGPLNAITDVPGVTVGMVTLISGDGPLVPGKGPIRTGVTAILSRGKTFDRPSRT